MGFCRRCGDIVAGERCKCGGLAVGPSVSFLQATGDRDQTDVWSRTYVRPSASTSSVSPMNQSSVRVRSSSLPANSISQSRQISGTPKNAWRPQSSYSGRPSKSNEGSKHDSSTARLPSMRQYSDSGELHDNASLCLSDPDILSDPDTHSLSKVYGSVLQPKETLRTFTCFICSIPFPPDATIYPDPNNPSITTRYLCKSCFTTNGGARGRCESCLRPVLMLSSEGGFVENAGRQWHRRCFRCETCFKDISNVPMVDLLGRPSCEDCFDSCLTRPKEDDASTPRSSASSDSAKKSNNIGGMKGSSRESNLAIDELHQRLGIKSHERVNHRDYSASMIESNSLEHSMGFNDKMSLGNPWSKGSASDCAKSIDNEIPTRGRYKKFRLSNSKSPKSPRMSCESSKDQKQLATQESDRDFAQPQFSSPASSKSPTFPPFPLNHNWVTSSSDLSDFSDANNVFSMPATPSTTSSSPQTAQEADLSAARAAQPKMILSSTSTLCAKCSKPLFRVQNGGKFVTVPEETSKGVPPKSFHVECFRCAVCDEPFQETKSGQAIFVRSSSGCCHVSCATPERIAIRPLKTRSSSISAFPSTTHKRSSSSHNEDEPLKRALSSNTSFPKFGNRTVCPGCRVAVSPMERGVVPGPQGSRWHAACLVCGGKSSAAIRRDPGTPGCGKRLDSAAKTDGDGRIWCRECLLAVPTCPKIPCKTDFMKNFLRPSHTGGNLSGRSPFAETSRIDRTASECTATSIARQLTGMTLATQLTGGSLNPTHQLPRSHSPTKITSAENHDLPLIRSKSVLGIRGKSLDEGRGMTLVRQFTGSGAGLS